jgi:UDP-N-acetyl-D-glucosamine dehydrogenase
MKISVVGLGYVGLPLAIQFARANVTVLGLDIDAAKVDSINQRRSYIGIRPVTRTQSDNTSRFQHPGVQRK